MIIVIIHVHYGKSNAYSFKFFNVIPCRNLFFRISHLLQLGVHLVFVIEGCAPELKQQVMVKRQETRFPQRKAVGGQRRGGRRNFNACLKEVRYLDKFIPYVWYQLIWLFLFDIIIMGIVNSFDQKAGGANFQMIDYSITILCNMVSALIM